MNEIYKKKDDIKAIQKYSHLLSDKKLALKIDQLNDINDINSILVENKDIILSVDIPSVIKTVKD